MVAGAGASKRLLFGGTKSEIRSGDVVSVAPGESLVPPYLKNFYEKFRAKYLVSRIVVRSQLDLAPMPRQAQQLNLVAKPPLVQRKRGKAVNRPMDLAGARTGLQNQWHDAETIDPNKPLTEKQKLFIRLVASGETIISATERAGYQNSPTYGYRLIKQPNARALLDQEKAKYEASVQMTRKKVMDGLLESIEMAKLAGEPASMIAGWREVGKMCGYYEPVTRKLDITVNGNVVMDRINRLSDQELLDLIQSGIGAGDSEDEGTPLLEND